MWGLPTPPLATGASKVKMSFSILTRESSFMTSTTVTITRHDYEETGKEAFEELHCSVYTRLLSQPGGLPNGYQGAVQAQNTRLTSRGARKRSVFQNVAPQG